MGQDRLKIDTKFVVGWLSKIADSEAFREKLCPKIVLNRHEIVSKIVTAKSLRIWVHVELDVPV